MTTLIAFTPSATASPPFTATITLDGAQYGLSVAWNAYAGRWYYSLVDQNQNTTITAALVGSPSGSDILLAPGLFSTSTILYRVSTGNFEVNP